MEIDAPKEKDLFKAAETGSASLFKSLLEKELRWDLSMRNEDGRSLLHVAVSAGRVEVVRVLAEAGRGGSIVNSTDEDGWAPLHSAASCGYPEIVNILLENGADINLTNDGGRTALHYAASKGWLKIAETLISQGAIINKKDKVGCTPLHRAASTGCMELCELLLEEGAEIDAIDRTGQTPLMQAVVCHNQEVIFEKKPSKQSVLCLNQEVEGKLLLSGQVMRRRLTMNYFFGCVHVPFGRHGKLIFYSKVALLLIRHGADVDIEDKEGYTALGLASGDLRSLLVDAAKAMLEG